MVALAAWSGRMQGLAGRISELASIWLQDCQKALPTKLRRRLALGVPAVRIAKAGDGNLYCVAASRSPHAIALSDLGRTQCLRMARRGAVRLTFDAEELLSTHVTVPAATIRYLRSVVRTNLSVWTPFGEDDIYYAAQSTRPDFGEANVTIEIRCVSRALVDARLTALDVAGLTADEIELGDPAFVIPLPSPKMARRRRLTALIVCLCLLALTQGAGLALLLGARQDAQIADLQAELSAVRRSAHDALVQVERRKTAKAFVAAIDTRRAGDQSIGHILERIAGTLPKTARLREITINETRGGSAILVSRDSIDPLVALTSTELFRVDEVNELASPVDGERVYTVSLSATTPGPAKP